jgi:hypothetical protein
MPYVVRRRGGVITTVPVADGDPIFGQLADQSIKAAEYFSQLCGAA